MFCCCDPQNSKINITVLITTIKYWDLRMYQIVVLHRQMFWFLYFTVTYFIFPDPQGCGFCKTSTRYVVGSFWLCVEGEGSLMKRTRPNHFMVEQENFTTAWPTEIIRASREPLRPYFLLRTQRGNSPSHFEDRATLNCRQWTGKFDCPAWIKMVNPERTNQLTHILWSPLKSSNLPAQTVPFPWKRGEHSVQAVIFQGKRRKRLAQAISSDKGGTETGLGRLINFFSKKTLVETPVPDHLVPI